MATRQMWAAAAAMLVASALPALAADEAATAGVPTVPATRREMLKALEASKHNQPRLPMPALTAEEREAQAKSEAKGAKMDWSVVNNGRMRKHYLPAEWTGAGFMREPDPRMTLGYPFQTMIFWVVSRGNNCTYCMGHQESKLAAAGVAEDRIAALDGDWADFNDAQRAAFAFAKKLTFEPQDVTDADLAALRRFYTADQVLEIIQVAAGFNAMNRWTGAIRIPQEEHRTYAPASSAEGLDRRSSVAPLAASEGAPACAAPARRPALESAAAVEAAIAAARKAPAHLPLASEADARAALPSLGSASPLPRWVLLQSTFPKAGAARIALHQATETGGHLGRVLPAQIAYIAARNDRAWYALVEARRRLAAQGVSPEAIAALDGPWDRFTPAERAAFHVARKLTVDPALISDDDLASLRKHFDDKATAEVVFQVTEAAFFDRLTEAAGLPPEAEATAK